tara:strand:- start:8617 stop:8838 length:222 start_codon:yes stop_codon:yes gene_type:complete
VRQVKYLIEKKIFGVLESFGVKLGISSAKVRLYFIYVTFLTLGSPVVIYLILAFWQNFKRYKYQKKKSIMDLI